MEVPISVVPALFNVSKLKECNIRCYSGPNAWINEFIQTFQQAAGELRVVSSVTIVADGGYYDPSGWPPSGVDFAQSGLVEPAQADVPPPRTAFLDKLLNDGIYCDEEASRTETKCELYVIANGLLAKRLHLYRWGVEEESAYLRWRDRSPRTYYHEMTHIVLVDL